MFGALAAGECSRSVACVVSVITLVTRVSGECLAINAVGLLRSSTNNRIGVCVAGCKFVPQICISHAVKCPSPFFVRFRLVFCLFAFPLTVVVVG